MTITYSSAHNDGYRNAIDDVFEFIEEYITEQWDLDNDPTDVEILLEKLQTKF